MYVTLKYTETTNKAKLDLDKTKSTVLLKENDSEAVSNPYAVIAADILDILQKEKTDVQLVNIPTVEEIEKSVRECSDFCVTDGGEMPLDLVAKYNGKEKTLICCSGGGYWKTGYIYEISEERPVFAA